MESGRLVLKYFTESELRPGGQGQQAPPKPGSLLTDSELDDIRDFSVEFGKANVSFLNRTRIVRKPHLRAFVMFLQLLGAVNVDDTPQGVRVAGTGRLTQHLPQILGIYLDNSLTLVDNWNNTHIIPEDSLSALELLRQMELRRIDLTRRAGRQPQPLASRPVAFAVFHAIDRKGKDCYLFEINSDWRRLNFIGGKQEESDGGDYAETVLREISEELGISRDRISSLTRINGQPLPGYGLSGNVGSLASYPCVLFGIEIAGPLNVRMQDRWLTEETIRACATMRDCPLMVNPVYLDFLLSGRPSHLSRVPVSTTERVRSAPLDEISKGRENPVSRWTRILSENKDLLAAMLTLLAAAITLSLAL